MKQANRPQRQQTREIILDDGKVLILDGGADLQRGGAAVQELHSGFRRIDSAGSQDRESRQSARDGRHALERDRPDGVAGHAAIGRPALGADRRPSHRVHS